MTAQSPPRKYRGGLSYAFRAVYARIGRSEKIQHDMPFDNSCQPLHTSVQRIGITILPGLFARAAGFHVLLPRPALIRVSRL